MKIIETNIYYDTSGNVIDHESRVIHTYKCWDEYVSLFQNYNGEAAGKYDGTLTGYVLPRMATINNLVFDNFHLRCNLRLWNESIKIKLAYKINEEPSLGIPLICGLSSNRRLPSQYKYPPNDNGVPIGVVNWIMNSTANCDIWVGDNSRWCHKEKQFVNGKSRVSAIWIEDN